MQDIFNTARQKHLEAIEKSFSSEHVETLQQISREILKCLKDGGKLLFCGNGGSASDSQHLAAEFVGRFHRERRGLPAIALTTDTAILTAVGNDYGFLDVFSRQVEALGKKGDLLIAISTSGNSANVLKAVAKAKEIGIRTVGLTGSEGGALRHEANLVFCAASKETPHIQEVHITVMHAVSEAVEKVLFGT